MKIFVGLIIIFAVSKSFGQVSPASNAVVGSCADERYWTRYFDDDNPDEVSPFKANDVERLDVLRRRYGICPRRSGGNPTAIEARVVGTNASYSTTGNVLTVTPRFGLSCYENQQPFADVAPCLDYKVRFCCPGNGVVGRCSNGNWGPWVNRDSPDNYGDYEQRYPYYSCYCGRRAPTAIESRIYMPNDTDLHQAPYHTRGVNRLNIFINFGLWCVQRQQMRPRAPSPPCNNYEVRYCCPDGVVPSDRFTPTQQPECSRPPRSLESIRPRPRPT